MFGWVNMVLELQSVGIFCYFVRNDIWEKMQFVSHLKNNSVDQHTKNVVAQAVILM